MIERLKGRYEGEAVLDLTVQTFPEEAREEAPEVGRTYILFSYPENAYQIRKVIAYSEENLKRARALIRGRTQSNKGMNRTRIPRRLSSRGSGGCHVSCAPVIPSVMLLSWRASCKFY